MAPQPNSALCYSEDGDLEITVKTSEGANERRRLAAARILDTPPDEAFERSAASVFQLPIRPMTLDLDSERLPQPVRRPSPSPPKWRPPRMSSSSFAGCCSGSPRIFRPPRGSSMRPCPTTADDSWIELCHRTGFAALWIAVGDFRSTPNAAVERASVQD